MHKELEGSSFILEKIVSDHTPIPKLFHFVKKILLKFHSSPSLERE